MRGRNYTKIPLYVQVSPRILSVGQENVLLSHISKEFEQATWQVCPHFFLFHRHLHATCRQPLLFFMEYHYEDFVGLIQKSIVEHWDLNALTATKA